MSTHKGEVFNRHTSVIERYGIKSVHLGDTVDLVSYVPKAKLRILPELFPDGIRLPKIFAGSNAVNLSTLKTDAVATINGSANVLASTLFDDTLLKSYHVLHDVLIDCITLAKEICSGVFTVTDGVFANEGPGPLSYMPHEKNILMASADPVAIDAAAAALMGFEPMAIPYIRIAHEAGLGCGDMSCIEIAGEDISDISYNFKANSREWITVSAHWKSFIHVRVCTFSVRTLQRFLLVCACR